MSTAAACRSIIATGAALVLPAGGVLVALGTPSAGASPSWSAANPPLPANALAGQGVSLLSSSCPADGWCVAVGDYPAVSSNAVNGVEFDAGLIESESGGTWSAMAAPLPADASTTNPEALLESVSCPAVGSCVAVGRYLDSGGATQGLVEQLSEGSWSPSTSPLPAGASSSGTSAYAQLTSVSCIDTCTAVGVYSASGDGQQAYVATGSDGA